MATPSGLSTLVIEDATDGGDMVVVTARPREDAVPCPVCETPTAKVHGYHGRTVTDVPVFQRSRVVCSRTPPGEGCGVVAGPGC